MSKRRTVPDTCDEDTRAAPTERRGALAMLGFAKRFRPTRTTEEWMAELREFERETEGQSQ
jgi:hypothetical protein